MRNVNPEWLGAVGRVDSLSVRERDVLMLLREGTSTRDLSRALNITERTVKAHLSSILVKLRVESRLQASIVAWEYSRTPCENCQTYQRVGR